MKRHQPLTPELLDRLRRELGREAVLTDPETLEACGRDESGLCIPPQAVIRASSTEQIAGLLRLANEYRFPVTPRGNGTGLAGGCVPVLGGVVLSLREMDRILAVDESNMLAVVQPGVLNQDLKDAVRAVGLCYPPDPASLDASTIGGNAATNAGGPACVKYGVTRQYVLGLTAVLPTGEIVRTGGRTRKNVVGYDLTQLLVGSEGTLGVITELTLAPYPPPRRCPGHGRGLSGSHPGHAGGYRPAPGRLRAFGPGVPGQQMPCSGGRFASLRGHGRVRRHAAHRDRRGRGASATGNGTDRFPVPGHGGPPTCCPPRTKPAGWNFGPCGGRCRYASTTLGRSTCPRTWPCPSAASPNWSGNCRNWSGATA